MEALLILVYIILGVFAIIYMVKVFSAACVIVCYGKEKKAQESTKGELITELYITGCPEAAQEEFLTALYSLFKRIADNAPAEEAIARIDKQIVLYQEDIDLLGLSLPEHMRSGKAFMDAREATAAIREYM